MEKIKEHYINPKRKIEETSNVSEPETFDTWTIITDPLNNSNKPVPEVKEYNNGNRIEILKDNIDRIEIKFEQDPDIIDELSDGISIISDSESGGRYSPTLLYTLENKKTENIKNEFENEIKKKEYEPIIQSISRTNRESFSQTVPNRDADIGDNDVNKCSYELSNPTNNLQITKIFASSSLFTTRNISLFFYLSAAIAIIAFVGKIKYPEWRDALQEEVIKQRVDDLELQNNLLRAEIDILSKQVKCLNKDTQSHTKSYKNIHNDNKFIVKKEKIKVWSGNGRNEPNEITKEMLKMPYSCEQSDKDSNGEYSEYNGVNKKKDKNSQQFYNLDTNDIKAGLKQTIEKIIPAIMQDNILYDNENIGKAVPENKNSDFKLYEPNAEKSDKKKYKKNEKYKNQNNREQINDKIKNLNERTLDININNKLDKHNKKENNKNKVSREDYHNREPDDPEENKQYTNYDKTLNSKVRNKYESSKYNNIENNKNKEFGQDFENYSNAKYKKKNTKKKNFEKLDEYYKENNKDKQHVDWHENMMKNREEYRKRHHEKWKSDNWYMDRASGREEARIFEKDQNKFTKMQHE